MNAPAVKGWCPGALRPMESGDGLIVRLKLTGGIVPLELAAKIAAWSARWGNGEIDLTSRANLQIRGIEEKNLSALQDAMNDAGILDVDPDGEAVRNVIASPLAGLDPHALIDIRPIVEDLEARLIADPVFRALPAKFGFLVDDGGSLSVRDVLGDVRFEAVHTSARIAFSVGLDGADEARFGPCAVDEVVGVAAALAEVFIERHGSDVRRMRDLVSRIGADAIVQQAAQALGKPIGSLGNSARETLQNPTDEAPFLRVDLAFGRISSDQLAFLTRSVAAYGVGEIRLTPWRAIVVPLPTEEDAARLSEALARQGLILNPDDPRLRIAACSGAPGCSRGTTPTRRDAERLAASIGAEPGIALHVSGCAKGCAHPRAAPVTLVGRGGRYDLVLNGTPSDSPSFHGLTLDEAAWHLRQITAEHSQGGTA